MSDYDGALLEGMNRKFDIIVEYLKPLSHLPHKVDQIDKRLHRVESDITVIKCAVTDQGKDHKTLEKHIVKLETHAA